MLTDGPIGRRTRLFERWHESMHSTATRLLDRARDAGAVRPDLTATDLLALASGAALTGADAAHTQRLVRLLRTGVEANKDATVS